MEKASRKNPARNRVRAKSMYFIVVGQIPCCTIGKLCQRSGVGRVCLPRTNAQTSLYSGQETFDVAAIISAEDQPVVAQYQDVGGGG